MRWTTVLVMLSVLSALSASAAEEFPFALKGQEVQGGLLIGQAPAESTVTLDGEPLMRSSDGYFLVGFSRDETAARELVIEAGGQRWSRRLAPAEREFNIQRIDGLPPSKVTPAAESIARIQAEAAQTRAAREQRDDRTDFNNGFIWPVTGPITGVYGSQRILNGEERNPHWGIDIAAPTGTPVLAPAGGIVTLVHEDMFFSGGTLLLDHGLGLSSAFLHLDRILVEDGQRVEQGDVIAEVGATGRVTGAHLDWRMNLGSVRVDPQLLVPPLEAEQ
ncbi:MAG: M23 family metallopeptidase [Pseudomonadota bacterium]